MCLDFGWNNYKFFKNFKMMESPTPSIKILLIVISIVWLYPYKIWINLKYFKKIKRLKWKKLCFGTQPLTFDFLSNN